MAVKVFIENTTGVTGFSPAKVSVWAGDQISWTNNTEVAHQPGVVNPDGSFASFQATPIMPGEPSDVFSPQAQLDSSGNQQAYPIHYSCQIHPLETGVIQVQVTP
jgi:plastocyanin